MRETKEETGIDVIMEGILRIEHTPQADRSKVRVIYLARPIDEKQVPKSEPDKDSDLARYVTLEEWRHLIEVQKEKARFLHPYVSRHCLAQLCFFSSSSFFAPLLFLS